MISNIDELINQLYMLKDNLPEDIYILSKKTSLWNGKKYIEISISTIKKSILQSRLPPRLPPPRLPGSLHGGEETNYLYKYLKYKQKYIEAQQLYGKELKGGNSIYFIYCPVEIYNLIQSLFLKDSKIKQQNCFFLLLGPRSFYDNNGTNNNLSNCWDNTQKLIKAPIEYNIFYITYNNSDNNWTINYAQIKK